MARALLAASLLLGAVFDAVFALGILYAPAQLAEWIGLALPRQMVYLQLCGVLLIILSLFYVVAAFSLERVPALAAVAAAGRLLGFVFFLRVWWSGEPLTFLLFGITDLVLASMHAGFLCLFERRTALP